MLLISTTCKICSNEMRGTPLKCSKCGAYMREYGNISAVHVNVAWSSLIKNPEKNLFFYQLRNYSKDKSEQGYNDLYHTLFKASKGSFLVTVPFNQDERYLFLENGGKYYIVLYMEMEVQTLADHETTIRYEEMSSILQNMFSDDHIDGIVIDPSGQKVIFEKKDLETASAEE